MCGICPICGSILKVDTEFDGLKFDCESCGHWEATFSVLQKKEM